MLPLSVRLDTFEYPPPPPPKPPKLGVVVTCAPAPPAPPPIHSTVLLALFQSAGTVHDVPDVRMICVTQPPYGFAPFRPVLFGSSKRCALSRWSRRWKAS